MSEIKFGTSGWRALYHVDFTLANVRIVCQAIADEVRRSPRAENGVVIGYDVRFMGRDFAAAAAEVLAGNGIRVLLNDRHVPTPVISHAIVQNGLAGGINFTASHNPYEYNGIKYSPESGGPALPEATTRIEQGIEALRKRGEVKRMTLEQARKDGMVQSFQPREAYFEQIDGLVRTGELRKLGEKRIAVDCKHAVAQGYLDRFLSRHSVRVHALNEEPDPYFGHEHPEPSAGHIDKLQKYVADHEDVAIGLACDGDADRFGIVDEDGAFVEPNIVLALLLDYLAESRGWTGGVARSVATTHLLDRVAAARGMKLHETPVGFKYIGDLLTRGEIVFGGEESAGLTIEGHLPEKDGILACLLVAEMVAALNKPLRQLQAELFERHGRVLDRRDGVRLTAEMEQRLPEKLANPPAEIAGAAVTRIDRTDGTKLFLGEEEWILLRKSGTEPLVRLYAEATSAPRLDELIRACRAWLEA